MELVQDLVAAGLWLFALVVFAAQAAAQQLGFLLGRRRSGSEDAKEKADSAGFVVGAVLALLAFTMAVTISFAQNRFEDRRAASVSEANAIGTAWLRARAVGGEEGAAIAEQLSAYLALRRAYVTAPPDPAVIAGINARTSAAQEAMWASLSRLVEHRQDAVVGLLMSALNEVFDAATVQRQAHASRLPRELVALLFGMTLLAIGVIGYQFGLRGRRHPVLGTILLLTWTGSLTLIADLSSARVGDLRTNPMVYDWTAEGMRGR